MVLREELVVSLSLRVTDQVLVTILTPLPAALSQLLGLALLICPSVILELQVIIKEHLLNLLSRRISQVMTKSDGSNAEGDHVLKSMVLDKSLRSVTTAEPTPLFNTQIGSNLLPLLKETKTPVQLHQFRDLALRMLHSVTEEPQDTLREPTFHQRTYPCLLLHSFRARSSSTQTLTSFPLRLESPAPTLSP